jgi:hypothetical protein
LIASATAFRHPDDLFFWLSAGSFALASLSLGFGALLTLLAERKVIRHLEQISGILKMRVGTIARPSAEIGLSFSHPQTWTAIVSAFLFLSGVAFSVVLIWRH